MMKKLMYRVEDSNRQGMFRKGSDGWGNDLQRHPMPWQDSVLVENVRLIVSDAEIWKIYQKDYEYLRDKKLLTNDRIPLFFWQTKVLYGFTTLEQLRSWLFNREWKKALYERGFHVSVYEYDEADVAVGDSQMVALIEAKNRRRLVETISLLDV